MEDDSSLVTASVLTAIWEDKQKDNIELIIPFIYKIIYEKYKINDVIEEEYIINQMKEKYFFNNFPIGVLKAVFVRLKKRNYLLKSNKMYYLTYDLKNEVQDFDYRYNQIKNCNNTLIKEFIIFYKKECNKEIDYSNAEKYIEDFIETHGFNAYQNILTTKAIERKKEVNNYIVGKFIYEYKDKIYYFDIFLNMIKGHMIANAIYLQVYNNNNASLKNLNCYLDTTFLLKVLGYKSKEENEMAKELYHLMKSYDIKLKCFRHTYDEIYNILISYKKNRKISKKLTLENFDKKKYTDSEIDIIISNLENKIRSLNISIDEKPEYSLYNYSIDQKLLFDNIKKHEISLGNSINEKSIQNDIESIAAINILRKGEKKYKIENCNSIFVTTYHYLVSAASNICNTKNSIGLAIDEIDLTTILWLKDCKKNNNLPKLRLIENAVAATNVSDELFEKVKNVLSKIKEEKLIDDINVITDFVSKNYLKSIGYIDFIKNDLNLVNEKNIIDYFNDKNKIYSEKDNEIAKLKLLNESLKKENEILRNNNSFALVDTIQIKKIEKIYNNIAYILNLILNIIYYLFCIFLIIKAFYITKQNNSISFNFSKIFIFIIGFLGITDSIIPKMNFFKKNLKKLINNNCDNLKSNAINRYFNKLYKKDK